MHLLYFEGDQVAVWSVLSFILQIIFLVIYPLLPSLVPVFPENPMSSSNGMFCKSKKAQRLPIMCLTAVCHFLFASKEIETDIFNCLKNKKMKWTCFVAFPPPLGPSLPHLYPYLQSLPCLLLLPLSGLVSYNLALQPF